VDRESYIYIMANNRPTLYIGVTTDLIRRVYEHKEKLVDGFTKKYDLTKLVYYEQFTCIEAAILREKQLKRWNRAWKLRLIREANPRIRDLYDDLTGSSPSRG
jgi:putative endonuclease